MNELLLHVFKPFQNNHSHLVILQILIRLQTNSKNNMINFEIQIEISVWVDQLKLIFIHFRKINLCLYLNE